MDKTEIVKSVRRQLAMMDNDSREDLLLELAHLLAKDGVSWSMDVLFDYKPMNELNYELEGLNALEVLEQVSNDFDYTDNYIIFNYERNQWESLYNLESLSVQAGIHANAIIKASIGHITDYDSIIAFGEKTGYTDECEAIVTLLDI